MKKQFIFERECIHRDQGAEGDFYNGMFFVQAPRVVVWLCVDCAAELHISDPPRAVVQSARR